MGTETDKQQEIYRLRRNCDQPPKREPEMDSFIFLFMLLIIFLILFK